MLQEMRVGRPGVLGRVTVQHPAFHVERDEPDACGFARLCEEALASRRKTGMFLSP
jgi:hypothetical protein